ncbi:MAG: FtsW/RodA/SpoVE family cell cycle protein [bacterium]
MGSRTKISPLFGLGVAVLVSILGMLSVYVAGNARGYEPSLAILVRNGLLMSAFFLVYSVLKKTYKGDFSILVVAALLTGIGFVVQYRISSAINVDFQKTLVRQYSAAAIKRAGHDSSAVDTTSVALVAASRPDERSLESIQSEASQLLKLHELSGMRFLREFATSLPGWSRLIVSYLVALFAVVFIVKKCASNRFMASLEKPFFWVAVTILMLLVFVALSEVGTRGRFVYKMTPWEAFKITIIVFLAGFFAKYKDDFTRKGPAIKGKKLSKFIVPWGPFLFIWLIPQLLFVLLKDFGQVIIYSGLVIIMIFVTTRKYIYLFGGITITVLTSKLIFLLEGIAPPHVLQRFVIWADLWRLPHDAVWWDNVYQIMNSFFALNAGGWTGAGVGLGYPTNIPLVVSDFVYSAIAEEIGFIGSILIVALYILLFLLGMRVAVESETDFEKLLATGFSTILAIQVFVNIGGVIKLIPLTGITLPLISRGGFSFLISLIIIGFIMGLSHRNGQGEFA